MYEAELGLILVELRVFLLVKLVKRVKMKGWLVKAVWLV
jgi:hypothetical protein